MDSGDENRFDSTDERASGLGEPSTRDLAMREALGLLDDAESTAFEALFAGMTPDEQAAVLDLQAAVAREIAGAGADEPDRSLRYRVLARLTEEMSSDPAARGPLATIGVGGSPSRRSTRAGSVAIGDPAAVSELQFDRVSRSAGVWRAAAFALGSAVLALGVLQYQAQSTIDLVVDRLGDDMVSEDLRERFGSDLDLTRFIDQQTAVATALIQGDGGVGAGVLLADPASANDGPRRGVLVAFKQPVDLRAVRVVAVLPSGEERELGEFDVRHRGQLAALPLDLRGVPEGAAFEVRDQATGVVLLRTA